jgi:hypothetical protein
MAHRFQFNSKNGESVEVEGMRVDMAYGFITVVDREGQPIVSFHEAELSTWYRVTEPSTQ